MLAKHDENYMPPEVAKSLKEQGLWQHDGKAKAGEKMKMRGRLLRRVRNPVPCLFAWGEGQGEGQTLAPALSMLAPRTLTLSPQAGRGTGDAVGPAP